MALTAAQQASIRLYLGFTARWGQVDTELEMAMSAIAATPEVEALITNALDGEPPGILATLEDIDVKLAAAHGRLKASQVGAIQLNAVELDQLRGEGRRHVGRLASLLGVSPRSDAFSGHGTSRDNYVGK